MRMSECRQTHWRSVARLNGFPCWSDLIRVRVKLSTVAHIRQGAARRYAIAMANFIQWMPPSCACRALGLGAPAPSPPLSSKLPMQITIIRCQLTLFYELKFNRYISDLITMWQIFAWAHPKLPKFNWKTFVRMENDIFDANAAAAAVDLWRLRSELRWFVAHV